MKRWLNFDKKVWVCLLALCTIYACNESTFEDVPRTFGDQSYLNLVEGKFQEFRYDTISYKGVRRDTFSGLLKIQIGEYFVNPAGDSLRKIYVYYKKDTADTYQLHRVETAMLDGDNYIVSEDGLRYIRAKVPGMVGYQWSATSLFEKKTGVSLSIYGDEVEIVRPQTNWDSEILEVDVPFTTDDGTTFPRTLSNVLVNDSTGISKKYVRDVYAKDIGLIYRHLEILEKTEISQEAFALLARKGYIVNLSMIDHN